MSRSLALLALACSACGASHSDSLGLPAIFGDHMVLQRGESVPVWGRAMPGATVEVTLGANAARADAEADGAWRVDLHPPSAGGPYALEVASGAERIVLHDVLVGDVWLGAGQSNMRMDVAASAGYDEARAAADLPRVRMFREGTGPAEEPDEVGTGAWIVCTPRTVGEFSGVLFAFGRVVYAEVDVPIGLVESSMSGTPIESWIDADVQRAHPLLEPHVREREAFYAAFDMDAGQRAFKAAVAAWREESTAAEAAGREPPREPKPRWELLARQGSPGALFRGKIEPLTPFTLRGALWYQGESNVERAPLYDVQLPLLVEDWRRRFEDLDLPFAWVQLPNFAEGRARSDWARVREAQRRALDAVPGGAMVVTIDVGDATELHPANKRAVGERLAAWALSEVYGMPRPWGGPLLETYETRSAVAILTFERVAGELEIRRPGASGFEVLDDEGVWHAAWAEASGDRVLVSLNSVPAPRAVRYAWASNPRVTLFDSAGLPASPFTTEELPSSLDE